MSRWNHFWRFYDQPIPPNYYYFLNNYDDDDHNISGNLVDNVFPENKRLKYAVMPNNEDIDDEIIIDGADILTSAIDHFQN